MRLDCCTKCGHYEAFHRQRYVRMWALDECTMSCFCIKFSSNKKFIGKFTKQGIPKNLTDEEQSRFAWDHWSRKPLEAKAINELRSQSC